MLNRPLECRGGHLKRKLTMTNDQNRNQGQHGSGHKDQPKTGQQSGQQQKQGGQQGSKDDQNAKNNENDKNNRSSGPGGQQGEKQHR